MSEAWTKHLCNNQPFHLFMWRVFDEGNGASNYCKTFKSIDDAKQWLKENIISRFVHLCSCEDCQSDEKVYAQVSDKLDDVNIELTDIRNLSTLWHGEIKEIEENGFPQILKEWGLVAQIEKIRS